MEKIRPKKQLTMGEVVAPRADISKRKKLSSKKTSSRNDLPQKTNRKTKKDVRPQFTQRVKISGNRFLNFMKRFSFIICFLIVLGSLYLPKLLTVPPVARSLEPDNLRSLLNTLADNVSYAPQKLIAFGLQKIGIDNGPRLMSVLVILLAVIFFYIVVSDWVSRRVAIMSTLLFATSSWTIYQARSDNFGPIYLLIIPLIFMVNSYLVNKSSSSKVLLLLLILSASLYTPGAVWFLLCSYLLMLVFYLKALSSLNIGLRILLLITPLFVLSPAFYLIYKNLNNLYFLGAIPTNISHLKENILSFPSDLFISGINNPAVWLPGTPIIDAATFILALSGVIYLGKSAINPFIKWSIGLFLALSLILIALNGSAFISIALPLIYFLTAIGITFLLEQWLHIFPINPLARFIGISVMSVLVILISGYHVTRYYIAWPRSDAYHQAFKS